MTSLRIFPLSKARRGYPNYPGFHARCVQFVITWRNLPARMRAPTARCQHKLVLRRSPSSKPHGKDHGEDRRLKGQGDAQVWGKGTGTIPQALLPHGTNADTKLNGITQPEDSMARRPSMALRPTHGQQALRPMGPTARRRHGMKALRHDGRTHCLKALRLEIPTDRRPHGLMGPSRAKAAPRRGAMVPN